MKTVCRGLAIAALAGMVSPALAQLALVPMDQQINLGYTYNTSQSPGGDAIYIAFSTGDTQEFMPAGGSEPEGWLRHKLNKTANGGAGGWWYQYVDLNLAGITTPAAGLDLSGPGSKIEFDARYFQDPDTNANAYGDAPIFVRIYTYGPDGNSYVGHRDYGIVYGPNATKFPYGQWYPNWAHVVIDVAGSPYTDGGAFNPANVSRIRFYGTDWSGNGFDFVDFKNLRITPEPASLALLALGGVAVLRRRRR